MPVKNRGRTIYSTLKSISKQSFRNFEVILHQIPSSDDTEKEIKRFLNSDDYAKNNFEVKYEKNNKKKSELKVWNKPLRKSKGKYVLKLEGDDQIFDNCLELAYKFLSENPNVGIYSYSNQYRSRRQVGWFSPVSYREYICSLISIPPPSETIFKRLNKKGERFLYDTDEFIYAPEADLYLQIVDDGYQAYHSERTMVFRDTSKSGGQKTVLKRCHDLTKIYSKNKENIRPETQSSATNRISNLFTKVKKSSKTSTLYRKVGDMLDSLNIKKSDAKGNESTLVNLGKSLFKCKPLNIAINKVSKRFPNPVLSWLNLNLSLLEVRTLLKGKKHLEDVIDVTKEYSGYGVYKSLRMTQHRSEIESLARKVKSRDPKVIVEIGTSFGGTYMIWAQYLNADHIVSIDIPGGSFGGGYHPKKTKLFDQVFPGTFSSILKNSHNKSTKKELQKVLGDVEIDFLFIDGDHTYEGVKSDFELYSPLVGSNGLVAFHDICYHPSPRMGVHKLWSEIKSNYDYTEYIGPEFDSFGHGGIGVISMP